jgi:hypothetical protein
MSTSHDEKGDIETGTIVYGEETEAAIHREYMDAWLQKEIAESRITTSMRKLRALDGNYFYAISDLNKTKIQIDKKKAQLTPEDVQCCKYSSMLIAFAITAAVVITYLVH